MLSETSQSLAQQPNKLGAEAIKDLKRTSDPVPELMEFNESQTVTNGHSSGKNEAYLLKKDPKLYHIVLCMLPDTITPELYGTFSLSSIHPPLIFR